MMRSAPTPGVSVSVAASTLDVQLPEDLVSAMERYLASRPNVGVQRLLQTALAQFLVQQGGARPEVRELYLEDLFGSNL